MKRLITLLFISLLGALPAHAQNQFVLSEIMKGKDFVGHWPENPFWNYTGEQIVFDWNPNKSSSNETYIYNVGSGKTNLNDPKDPFSTLEFDRNQVEFSDQYSSHEGNLVRYDKKTKKITTIYSLLTNVRNIQRLSNPNRVAFQVGNNLFIYDRAEGSFEQITDILLEDEKKENKEDNYIEKEEKKLFLFVQEETKDAENAKKLKDEREKRQSISPIYLGKNNLNFLQISPDEATLYLGVSSKITPTNTQFGSFVNTDGTFQAETARPKVGEPEPEMKVLKYDRKTKKSSPVVLNTLSDFQKKPDYYKEYGDSNQFYMTDRLIYIHAPKISSSNQALFDIRSRDNKDRWLAIWSTDKDKLIEINHQHDEAWIGGPGIEPWDVVPGTLEWISADEFIFQSEETGYSHLYKSNVQTKSTTALTEGKFEISDVQLSKDKKSLYFVANKTHPGNKNYYQLDIQTKKWKVLWEKTGAIQPKNSPDDLSFCALVSTALNPWELLLIKGNKETPITNSTTTAYKSLKLQEPAVITFAGKDGKDVYARLYTPKPDKSNQAAVLFVHGAGYLQNAHHYWSNYYREFLFHQLLIEQGFTVLDIDYRASEGYGRDYRTAIYQHMGGMDLNDQLSGKEYLVKNLNVDPNRIGIYGGSYGGFITLMALLTKPNEFACGAALRSVTDWAHYNHEYTSNILNYPNSDPKAYQRSSPIYFAENLQDPLLMLHGMVDDNVQFQDVVRLSQRFIELGKKEWDIAIYPVEPHGFVKSYSWTDEYRRIYELFTTHLLK